MLLEIRNLDAGYGKTQIIYDISLTLKEGEILSFIGHNGAGKSTTLKAIFGLLRPYRGRVVYKGKDITGLPARTRIERGIRFIPQEHFIFDDLTVQENLDISILTLKNKSGISQRFTSVYALFPVLQQRLKQRAGTLSGGERRMLSLGTALLVQPELLILDEPSLGLSPVMVQHVMETIKRLNTLGMTILLVEQNVKQALKVSNRVHVMKTGHIILEEAAVTLLSRGEWWDLF